MGGEKNKMIYFHLFYEFFKTGLFAIGGGMATIPFLMDIAKRYDWFTTQDLANMIAISESTPGPIGINMATYAGYQAAGLPGALTATFSLVLPALIIIVLIARFSENRIVKAVFYGLRPAIAALILYAVWQIAAITLLLQKNGKAMLNAIPVLICAAVFLILQWKPAKKLHPILWIILGAVLGVILQL